MICFDEHVSAMYVAMNVSLVVYDAYSAYYRVKNGEACGPFERGKGNLKEFT